MADQYDPYNVIMQAQQPPQPGMGLLPLQAPATPQSGYDPLRDPKVREFLLSTYGNKMELDALEKQAERVRALRRESPEGREAGRVYVAANPLEHIGAAWQNYNVMKKERELEEGIRNPNYAPGVLMNPESQEEYTVPGMKHFRKQISEALKEYGKAAPEY